ncbi:MAG TPA: LysM peptidoglycan-binding domain-containing protein [Phototrophicaceae bacterium]|nr:LysM peptidoglycan-binding domain-containing protein [Phototrophicaceae bacterium]
MLPTPLQLPAGLPLPTAQNSCPEPAGWVQYIVQTSDTLYDIAQAVGSSIEVLVSANCLTPSSSIVPGMSLSVPQLPATPVATTAPVIPASGTPLAPQGCTAPGVRIIAPTAGQTVSGLFNLVGAAALPAAGYYQIDIRPDSAETFMAYSRGSTSVIGGVLAQINSSMFDKGLHWVRLTVYTASGSASQSCAIPLIFG